MLQDVSAHQLAILLDLEEVVALADQLDLRVMRRAEFAVDQFLFGVEALAADAVEPLVVAQVDVV